MGRHLRYLMYFDLSLSHAVLCCLFCFRIKCSVVRSISPCVAQVQLLLQGRCAGSKYLRTSEFHCIMRISSAKVWSIFSQDDNFFLSAGTSGARWRHFWSAGFETTGSTGSEGPAGILMFLLSIRRMKRCGGGSGEFSSRCSEGIDSSDGGAASIVRSRGGMPALRMQIKNMF